MYDSSGRLRSMVLGSGNFAGSVPAAVNDTKTESFFETWMGPRAPSLIVCLSADTVRRRPKAGVARRSLLLFERFFLLVMGFYVKSSQSSRVSTPG